MPLPADQGQISQQQGMRWGDPGQNEVDAAYFAFGGLVVDTRAGLLNKGPSPHFNIKSYGAKGDNVADDAPAFTAAVTAAKSTALGQTTYATIFIPPGTYKLATPITIPNTQGIKFQGAGMYASTLNPTTSAFSITTGNGFDVAMMDFSVYGGSNSLSINSVVSRLTVERVVFQAGNVSVNVASGQVIAASFKNCLFNNNSGDNVTFASGVVVNNVLFEQCVWEGSSFRSFVNFNDTAGNVTAVKFARCLFDGPANSNTVAWILSGGVNSMTFDNCHFADATLTAFGAPLFQTYGVANGAPYYLNSYNTWWATADNMVFNILNTGAANGYFWTFIGGRLDAKAGVQPITFAGNAPQWLTLIGVTLNTSAQTISSYNSQAVLINVNNNGTVIAFEVLNQTTTTGNTHTVAAGATTNVFTNTTFDGSTGSTAYTVGDIVKALKAYGLLTS